MYKEKKTKKIWVFLNNVSIVHFKIQGTYKKSYYQTANTLHYTLPHIKHFSFKILLTWADMSPCISRLVFSTIFNDIVSTFTNQGRNFQSVFVDQDQWMRVLRSWYRLAKLFPCSQILNNSATAPILSFSLHTTNKHTVLISMKTNSVASTCFSYNPVIKMTGLTCAKPRGLSLVLHSYFILVWKSMFKYLLAKCLFASMFCQLHFRACEVQMLRCFRTFSISPS